MNLHLYIRNIVFWPTLLMSENCIYVIHQSMSIDILLYYLFSCIILLHSMSGKTFNFVWLHSTGLFTLKSPSRYQPGNKKWSNQRQETCMVVSWKKIKTPTKNMLYNTDLAKCFKCLFDKKQRSIIFLYILLYEFFL